MTVQSFYTTQSKYSDPGKLSNKYDELKNNIIDICKVVHNLVVHQNEIYNLYNFKIPSNKQSQPNTRYIEKILDVIVNNNCTPLYEHRQPQERFIGSCRDFALLTCSILRHKKIPARVRCGFAKYFHNDWYSDHWVCEYFDNKSHTWKLADAELGDEEIKKYHIQFDCTSISREEFLTGGKAWILARNKKINPDIFGVKEINVKGLWFIKANVIRDLAALKKIELLPWDYTDFIDRPFKKLNKIPDKEVHLIDEIADVTTKNQINYNDVCNIYNLNREIQIPTAVKSYTSKDSVQVIL